MKGKLFNWIGGKKWLAKDLNEVFSLYQDNNIKYYIEPFMGGLGSFLSTVDTIKNFEIETIYLNDVNKTIVKTYQCLKEDFDNVFNLYMNIENKYKETIPEKAYTLHKTKDKEELKIILENSKDYFNNVKRSFNQIKDSGSVESVAMFLFLASHSFNGVYRENSRGEYNTPYNWEPGVVSEERKREIFKEYSILFNELNIEFTNMDCFEFMDMHKDKINNALLYCDPPYLNEDIGENKYNKEHFGRKEQEKLLDYYIKFKYVVFSNHMYSIFEDFCIENNFKYRTCYRRNIMSAKKETRGEKVPEILAFKI